MPLSIRNLNTIYGPKDKDEKRVEGVASITTSEEFQRDTETLHKIQKIGGLCTDISWRL